MSHRGGVVSEGMHTTVTGRVFSCLRRMGGVVALCAVMSFSLRVQANSDDLIRINQLQYIGSHNSYHAGLAPGESTVWKRTAPELFKTINYSHPKLDRQLDEGVRQIELDIALDARGGLYAHPAIEKMVAGMGLPADPAFADAQVMSKPGIKVLHIFDFDQRSTCEPLVECLDEIHKWSLGHPHHLPLFILLETEDVPLHAKFPTVIPEKFTSKALDGLDAEIRSVFAAAEFIGPDQVRGSFSTLNLAIRKRGWPTLADARGKVIFLLDQQQVGPAYLLGHPSLRGRVLFTNAAPGTADAAFVERNDGSPSEITKLVNEGYLVRTRTDADLKEAIANDVRRRDAMFASGAQLLSTDYWRGESASSGYVVKFPEGQVARCNPRDAPVSCVDALLGE